MLISTTLLDVLQLAMAVGADLSFKIERLTALLSATVPTDEHNTIFVYICYSQLSEL